MADNQIEIEIILDDGKVVKGFGKLKQEADSTAESISSSFLKGPNGALLKLSAVAGAAALAIGAIITKKSIDAAKDYEEHVNDFNSALARTGKFSSEAAEGFFRFASEIQKTTKFSDDQVLSTGALIQNLGNLSNKGLKQATQAALDLSAALRIDLDTAATLVGKAATGNVAAFSRLGLQIKKGKTDAETYANALAALSKFQGAAEKSANTLAGAQTKLGNAFGDIFKEIGRVASRSPALITFIKEISKGFEKFTAFISVKIGNKDIFKDFLINMSVIIQATAETGRRIGLEFELAFLRAQQAWQAFKVLTTAGMSDAFNEELNNTINKIEDVKAELSKDTEFTMFFDNLIAKLSETNGHLTSFTDGVKNIPQAFTETSITMQDALDAFASQFQMTADKTKLSGQEIQDMSAASKEKMVKDFQEIGLAARNGLGSAVGAGFAAFGRALVTGKNALQEFAKAFIGAIGAVAVQEGTSMILRGIGYSLDPFLAEFGPPLIHAGAALAAFGGVLQGLSAGGAGAPSSSSSGGGGGLVTPDSGSTLEPNEQVERGQQVIVNVEGQILDPVGTATRIAELLAEITDSNDIAVRT